MTESEWLAATDPAPMLMFLREAASERKLRLFVTASCRERWAFLPQGCRMAVGMAEEFADGGSREELRAARQIALADERETAHPNGRFPYLSDGWRRADQSYWAVHLAVDATRVWLGNTHHSACAVSGGAERVRDIFGNPFRPVTPDPAWLTSAVLAISHQMYDSRDFSPMPVLADALQEAGCDDQDVLDHCRGDGPHTRGCWVIDLLTGRQ